MAVRIEVPKGSTGTVQGPAKVRIIADPGAVELDGAATDSPRIEIPDSSTVDVVGPAILVVTTDVVGSVQIDGQPVDPGAPVPDVAPAISTLSPATAVAGDATDITMIVTGTGYMPNSIIQFGGLDEPTVMVSDTELSTIVKPSLFVPDDVPVAVRNGNAISNELTFTFTAASQRSKSHGAKDAEAGKTKDEKDHQATSKKTEEKKE